jgi:hypothetical protein
MELLLAGIVAEYRDAVERGEPNSCLIVLLSRFLTNLLYFANVVLTQAAIYSVQKQEHGRVRAVEQAASTP